MSAYLALDVSLSRIRMADATPQQIQNFSDQVVRPISERARALVLAMDAAKAAIDDIYAALNGSQSGWTDVRTDAPPHLATASDILSWNTFISDIDTAMKNHAQYAVVLRLCVQPIKL
jgi:hypothetical protein